eukprot:2654046-Prymnesium_polylepis.2
MSQRVRCASRTHPGWAPLQRPAATTSAAPAGSPAASMAERQRGAAARHMADGAPAGARHVSHTRALSASLSAPRPSHPASVAGLARAHRHETARRIRQRGEGERVEVRIQTFISVLSRDAWKKHRCAWGSVEYVGRAIPVDGG